MKKFYNHTETLREFPKTFSYDFKVNPLHHKHHFQIVCVMNSFHRRTLCPTESVLLKNYLFDALLNFGKERLDNLI